MSGRGGRRGQALIETAITLPIMIALFLGFLAVGLAVQGAVDLNTAVYLATASAVTCAATATVRLSSTFAIVPDLPLTATATATVPAYRSA